MRFLDLQKRQRELREMIQSKAPNAREELEKVISSGEDPGLRARAISMLGRHFPEGFPTLLKLLEDTAQPLEVRRAVLGAILDNKYSDGLQAAKMVVDDREQHERLRTTAFLILAELDPKDGRSAVLKAIKNSSEPERLRSRLVSSTHPKYESDAQELLVEIASDPDESGELRVEALGALEDCTAVGNDLFLRIIRDNNENRRDPPPMIGPPVS